MNMGKVGYYSAAAITVVTLGSVLGISANAAIDLVLMIKDAI